LKDPHLKDHYGAAGTAGKPRCKKALLARMGLPATRKRTALIGIISRLTGQKGFDLIEEAWVGLMKRDVRVVVLGAGEERYVKMFREAESLYPDRVAARIGFDESLAHLIEAGSDMFLMPSRYEPCGLNQMYSLAYGTVPVVRATGGLADTVFEEAAGPRKANGFVFHEYDGASMLAAIDRALAVYADSRKWARLMQVGMKGDHSWARSARVYAQLYEKAARKAGERLPASRQYA
jgi:starch synthase